MISNPNVNLEFLLEVARGKIPGMSSVNKFGRNIEIDAAVVADIWDGGNTADESLLWVAPTAASRHNIKSTSPNDVVGGTGARTLRAYGLADWDTAEISEDIAMDGINDVAMVNAMVILHRMLVLTKGATDVNVGTITATATAPSAATVTAKIRPGQGQTQMAIYGIPSIQQGYLPLWYAGVNNAAAAAARLNISLLFNPEPNVELLNFLVKETRGLLTVGTSAPDFSHPVPKSFDGPGILKVQALAGMDNMDVSAGFDLVLVNN